MSSYYNDIAEVQRLSYTWNLGSYSSTGECYRWYLKPNTDDTVDTGKNTLGRTFHFQTEVTADIKESDKLKINGETYTVKAVTKHRGIQLHFLRAIVTIDIWST